MALSNFGCVGADGNPPVHVNGRITIRPYIISHTDFERSEIITLGCCLGFIQNNSPFLDRKCVYV